MSLNDHILAYLLGASLGWFVLGPAIIQWARRKK